MIVPTLGRPSLLEALASAESQLAAGDEILVVADPAGDLPRARRLADVAGGRFFTADSNGRGRGGAQRHAGMAAARGSHLCFLDDDDEWLPGTLALFREAACNEPVCFRVQLPDRVAWAERTIRPDNISGIAIVVPNEPTRLGEWVGHDPAQPERGADYTFFAGCCDRMGPPVWREEIVAVVGA